MVWGCEDCEGEDCNNYSDHQNLLFPKDSNSSAQYTDYTLFPSTNLINYLAIIHRQCANLVLQLYSALESLSSQEDKYWEQKTLEFSCCSKELKYCFFIQLRSGMSVKKSETKMCFPQLSFVCSKHRKYTYPLFAVQSNSFKFRILLFNPNSFLKPLLVTGTAEQFHFFLKLIEITSFSTIKTHEV